MYTLEQYLKGVVPAEIGNSHIEACKAQAIASRTYAWFQQDENGNIIDPEAIGQAFSEIRMQSGSYPNAHKAVEETAGLLLYYDGKIINSCPYSASNGGKITSSKERWGGHRAWLVSKEDPWDLAATGGKKRGHGVGMSQEGAAYAARQGFSCEEILAFYYPGCVIRKVGEPAMDKAAKVKEWALSRVGCPYVYGGTGKTCTVSYRQQRAEQYPESAE